MKKTFAVLLCSVLLCGAFIFTGCGDNSQQLAELEAKIEQLENQLNGNPDDGDDGEVDSLNAQIAALKGQITSLNGQISSLQSTITSLGNLVNGEASGNSALSQKIAELTGQTAALTEQLNIAKAQVELLSGKVNVSAKESYALGETAEYWSNGIKLFSVSLSNPRSDYCVFDFTITNYNLPSYLNINRFLDAIMFMPDTNTTSQLGETSTYWDFTVPQGETYTGRIRFAYDSSVNKEILFSIYDKYKTSGIFVPFAKFVITAE